MRRAVLVLCLLSLTGCATAPSTTFWNPLTWFSRAEANAADRAEEKLTTARKDQNAAREDVLKAAQRAAHEAALALLSAPPSRPVEVASEAADHAAASLDQALGALPANTRAAIRAQVASLLSENATLRAEGEQARAQARASDAELSRALETTRVKVERAEAVADAARADLREAFDRENALANQLRNQRFLSFLTTAGSVLATAAAIAYRLNLGNFQTSIATGLAELRKRNPSAAEFTTQALDFGLSRAEQTRLSKLVKQLS